MAGKSYELWLEGMDVPNGQISFAQLGQLALNLQDLVTRIGRQIDDRSGPGRTPISLGRATEIRLVSLEDGSTKLGFEIGDPNTLELPGEAHTELVGRFEEIVRDLAVNEPPQWADRIVTEAAGTVARTIRDLGARSVRLSRTEGEPEPLTTIDPRSILPTVWVVEPDLPEQREVTRSVSGRLEAVDLSAHRFRVRDDTGRAIRLENVLDDEHVGRLVGGRVIATGVERLSKGGSLGALENASVVPQHVETYRDEQPAEPALFTTTRIELDDEELDAFLQDLRS